MLGCRWAARVIYLFWFLSRSSFLVLPLFVLVGSVGIVSFTLCLPPPPTSPCANPGQTQLEGPRTLVGKLSAARFQ